MDHERKENPERYCPKLGHKLGFSYCKVEKEGMPCKNILNCWAHKDFVDKFLTKFKKEEIQYIYEPPGPKLSSLMEIVERVEKRLKDSEN